MWPFSIRKTVREIEQAERLTKYIISAFLAKAAHWKVMWCKVSCWCSPATRNRAECIYVSLPIFVGSTWWKINSVCKKKLHVEEESAAYFMKALVLRLLLQYYPSTTTPAVVSSFYYIFSSSPPKIESKVIVHEKSQKMNESKRQQGLANPFCCLNH